MSVAYSPTFPSLHLRPSSFSNLSVALPTSQLILQTFRCFTYVTALCSILQPFRHFTYVPLILQSFCRFTYVTAHSGSLPLLHLRRSSFSNPTFASPTSQALHLRHQASRPCDPEVNVDMFSMLLPWEGCCGSSSMKRTSGCDRGVQEHQAGRSFIIRLTCV